MYVTIICIVPTKVTPPINTKKLLYTCSQVQMDSLLPEGDVWDSTCERTGCFLTFAANMIRSVF